MQFQTLITILPILFSLTTAAPIEATALTTASSAITAAIDSTAAPESADKFCILGKCIGAGSNKSPGCNIDQCFSAASPVASTCAKAALKKKSDIFDKIQCAAVLLNLGGNMPNACRDCVEQLKHL